MAETPCSDYNMVQKPVSVRLLPTPSAVGEAPYIGIEKYQVPDLNHLSRYAFVNIPAVSLAITHTLNNVCPIRNRSGANLLYLWFFF